MLRPSRDADWAEIYGQGGGHLEFGDRAVYDGVWVSAVLGHRYPQTPQKDDHPVALIRQLELVRSKRPPAEHPQQKPRTALQSLANQIPPVARQKQQRNVLAEC